MLTLLGMVTLVRLLQASLAQVHPPHSNSYRDQK
jgi:hypothetical protein